MHQFTVYKTDTCPYCTQAKAFLSALQSEREDVTVKYVDAHKDRPKFQAMAQRTRTSTVPQIFVDQTHIGGWDQLARAAGSGRLDTYFETGAWPEPVKKRWFRRA